MKFTEEKIKELQGWSFRVRGEYRRGKLTDIEIAEASKLGFNFENRYNTIWMSMYEQFKEYQKKFKSSQVSIKNGIEYEKLRLWTILIRQRKNKLPAWKRELLDKVNFQWCHGRKTLKDTHPKLYSELHPTLNRKINIDVNTVSCGNGVKLWWKSCSKNHPPYLMAVHWRVKGARCPYCSRQKVLPNEAFGKVMPKLLKDWDYKENKKKGIDPFDILPGSARKISLKCHKCGNRHEKEMREYSKGNPWCKCSVK